MEVSLEGFLLTNLLMDAVLLSAVSRARGRVSPGRVLPAAAMGALYAALAQASPVAALKGPPGQLFPALLLSWLVLRREGGRPGPEVLSGALCLLAGAVFLGGAQFFLGRRFSPLPALVLGACGGTLALEALSRKRAARLSTWEVRLRASTAWGRLTFTALVDTGNRLREPFSGRPVLVAEADLLRPLLPPGFDPLQAALRPPPGFRAVGFGALGGSGRLACFFPASLEADAGKGFRPAPQVWIAVYPGRMAGSLRALAPPALAGWKGERGPR